MLIKPIFHHCRPIVDFFGNQTLEDFTHVYKIEEMGRLEKDLSEWTEKEVVFERRQTGGKDYFLRDLTKQQLKKLIKFYKADYDLLTGYYNVDDLWKKWRGEPHSSDVPQPSSSKKKIIRFTTATINRFKPVR